jgi:hypothetical protein
MTLSISNSVHPCRFFVTKYKDTPALPNVLRRNCRYWRALSSYFWTNAAAVMEGELNNDPFFLWNFITSFQSSRFTDPSATYDKYVSLAEYFSPASLNTNQV